MKLIRALSLAFVAVTLVARADDSCPNRHPKPWEAPAPQVAPVSELLMRIVRANLGLTEGRTSQLGLNCRVRVSELAGARMVGNFFYPSGPLNHSREVDLPFADLWTVNEAASTLVYARSGSKRLTLTYDPISLHLEKVAEEAAAESCLLTR